MVAPVCAQDHLEAAVAQGLRRRATGLPRRARRPHRKGRGHARAVALKYVPPSARKGPAMKLSARNVLKGKIVEVVRGQMMAQVRIDIGGTVITSSITSEAADDLGLKPGMAASAVIKSSDIIVAID